ncbi:hypothetical protein BDR03DRAFT_986462 [Suillus americanus]|nr:hypothetical protein BDR03DRAFT_986462 [Suillus americanus]
MMPTPTCPKCGKVFTKDSSITRHLSQPWTSCHSSVHDIVDILEFMDVVPPQRSLDPTQNLDTSVDMGQGFGVGGDLQFDSQARDSMDTNLDGDLTRNLPPTNEEWYEGAARCYSQDGVTFLDLFDADEHAEYRKENLFYPFASREEWEVADFLLCSALSMAAINTFLQLSMIKQLRLSFNNAKDLQSWAEMLPKGPSWKSQFDYFGGTRSSVWRVSSVIPSFMTNLTLSLIQSLHITRIVPLVQSLHVTHVVQSLHVNNNHLSKSDIHHMLHPCLYTQRRSSIWQQQTEGQDKPGEPFKARILSAHLASIPADSEVRDAADTLNLAQEVLDAVLWTYHEKGNKFERGYFPEYDTDMCQLLCGDLFMFRTELKKVIISIAKRAYDIFPQGSAMQKEEIKKLVTAAATRLLKSCDYLQLPDSSGGQFKNFMVQALKDACLKFYYSNSKKALKNTDEFCRTIPINAMLLVAAVLKGVISGFRKTGTDKVPDLTAKQCRTHFVNLQKSVDTLLDIPERCKELEDMLEQWARIGMGDFDEYAAGSVAGSDMEDINIIL